MSETFLDRLAAFIANDKAVHGTDHDEILSALEEVTETVEDEASDETTETAAPAEAAE